MGKSETLVLPRFSVSACHREEPRIRKHLVKLTQPSRSLARAGVYRSRPFALGNRGRSLAGIGSTKPGTSAQLSVTPMCRNFAGREQRVWDLPCRYG